MEQQQDNNELVLIGLMREYPNGEVQLLSGGELVGGTRPYQVTASIEAMIQAAKAEAWAEGEAAGQDNADSNRGYSIEHKYNPYTESAL